MVLAIFGISYLAAAVVGYFVSARTARSIPYPNWIWEESEGEQIERAA